MWWLSCWSIIRGVGTKVGLAFVESRTWLDYVSVMVVCTIMYGAGKNGGFLESEGGTLLRRVAVGIYRVVDGVFCNLDVGKKNRKGRQEPCSPFLQLSRVLLKYEGNLREGE